MQLYLQPVNSYINYKLFHKILSFSEEAVFVIPEPQLSLVCSDMCCYTSKRNVKCKKKQKYYQN